MSKQAISTNTNTNTQNRRTPDMILSVDNIIELAEKSTLKTLAVVYAQSGNPFVQELYKRTVADIKNKHSLGYVFTDGYDLVQTAIEFLCPYIGHNIGELSNVESKGEKLTVFRAMFKALHAVLRSNRQTEYKRVYLEDILFDTDGNEIATQFTAVPFKWDLDDITALDCIENTIELLNLTDTQQAVLNMRLQGESVYSIAIKRGRNKKSIYDTLSQIAKKYCDIFDLDYEVIKKTYISK